MKLKKEIKMKKEEVILDGNLYEVERIVHDGGVYFTFPCENGCGKERLSYEEYSEGFICFDCLTTKEDRFAENKNNKLELSGTN